MSESFPTPTPEQELTGQIGRTGQPPRSAWIEIDLAQLRRNFALVRQEMPPGVRLLAVVKDGAYGHGMLAVARAALEAGAAGLVVNTLTEAMELRGADVTAPILTVGERHPDELPFCVEYGLTVSVGDSAIACHLNQLCLQAGQCLPVHLKIDTGMSRFGFRWTDAGSAASQIKGLPGLVLEGGMSHFAMSDETDKSFARLQLARFREALDAIRQQGVNLRTVHLCNSGGYLDLPEAHFDAVRLGILPLGVHPSAVCRRIPGLRPVMSVKARLVVVRNLEPGDSYGYGMRYRAEQSRRIAIIPVGYGDGYPRLRNSGHVLVQGRRAPIIGGVAMDALAADVTDIPAAQQWDEAVLQGMQGQEEISAHDIARWGGTVSYDILAGWRSRLPRLWV
jgi:alanine racemase